MHDAATRRLTAWMACLAFVLASLGPSISQLLLTLDGSASVWHEICSASGLDPVGSRQPDVPSPFGKSGHSASCSFCLAHAGSPGLLSSATFALDSANASSIAPASFVATHSAFARVTPPSHAPPTLS